MEDQHGQHADGDRKVFIGDLTFQETDFQKMGETLRKAFRDPEAIEDVKINPNRAKAGYFYAFVTFRSAEDARKAVENEYIAVNRYSVRVQKYAPRSDNQVYIREIGGLSRQSIENELKKFGKITNLHMFAQSTGSSTHACTVKFEREEDAEACLKQRELPCEGIVLKFEKNVREIKHQGKELFLRKIPSSSDKKQLEATITKELEKFGKLARPVEIEYKEEGGRSFGTAVVTYEDSAALDRARKDFNRGLLGNDLLDLDFFKSRKDRDTLSTIYASHIHSSVPLDTILERFGAYGKIENHSIYRGETRRGDKIQKGTVTFENKDSVTAILSDVENPKLSELFLEGDSKITLFLDKADRAQYMKTVKPYRQPQNYSQQPYSMMHMMQMGIPPNMGMMPGMMPMPGMPPMSGMPGMPGMPGMGMMPGGMNMPGMMPPGMQPYPMGQPSMMQQRGIRPSPN